MNIICYDSEGEVLNNLSQWDLDRKLYIEGVKSTVTPVFRFFNEDSEHSLEVHSEAVEDKIVVPVPNILLQSSLPITVGIYVQTENEGKTVYYIHFPVIPQPKPEGYAYTETEVITLVKIEDSVKKIAKGLEDLKEEFKELDESKVSTEKILNEAVTKEKLSLDLQELLENKESGESYIWYANFNAVARTSNPFVKIGNITDFKQSNTTFSVIAAKSVTGSIIVPDLSATTVDATVSAGSYSKFHNGDLLLYVGSALGQEVWRWVPQAEAKEDRDGNMSAWDKRQVNKIPNLEDMVKNARLPVFASPNPPEGWQTNWLFDNGWYLGGIKKDCGGHPPVLNDNHTSWAILVLNGMATDHNSLNHNHRLQVAFDLVNAKIYMRRGWMSSNTWADVWTDVGAIPDGSITKEKLAVDITEMIDLKIDEAITKRIAELNS